MKRFRSLVSALFSALFTVMVFTMGYAAVVAAPIGAASAVAQSIAPGEAVRPCGLGPDCPTLDRHVTCCQRCCMSRSHDLGDVGAQACILRCQVGNRVVLPNGTTIIADGLCCESGLQRCREQACGSGQC